jgi:hypothetical protein
MTSPNTDTMAQEPAPGTREALIEALALAIAARHGHDKAGLERSPSSARIFEMDALAAMPVVVELVGAWLLRPGSCVPWLAREWREEMAA